MSVYDHEKIYPNLPPSAPPQDAQVYRLKQIEDIERFFHQEIKERENLHKKFNRWTFITRQIDHALIAFTVITSRAGIAALVTGIGAPLALACESIALVMGLSQIGVTNTTKRLYKKAIKHDAIRLLAESKLDTVHDKISRALENGCHLRSRVHLDHA